MKKTSKHTKLARKRQIVESLHAAAVLCETTPAVITRAKQMACPAFEKGNRIDVEVLRSWLKENDGKMLVGENFSRENKTNQEIRKLKLANDRAEGLMILRKTVAEKHREIAAKVKDLIYGKLENEFPPLFSNDVVSNRMLGRKLADQILGHFQDLAEVWDK